MSAGTLLWRRCETSTSPAVTAIGNLLELSQPGPPYAFTSLPLASFTNHPGTRELGAPASCMPQLLWPATETHRPLLKNTYLNALNVIFWASQLA